MIKMFKVSFIAMMLAGSALSGNAMAQSADATELRLNQMEEQMRMLVGQVEELTFTVKQLQGQLAASRKTGALEQGQTAQPKPALQQKAAQKQTQSLQAANNGSSDDSIQSSGLEQIEDIQAPAQAAPQQRKVAGAVVSGGLGTTKSAEPGDGGFQGQVLVAPGGEEVANAGSGGVENVALETEDPQSLYRQANESLVDRQYANAEQGFSTFLQKYPNHSLAGAAQYWLGETYYVQGDFRTAAQNFLKGYQDYPKSRRAPDSLLKLGLALNRMGEKDKACASLSAVSVEFPNAVEAKKRAQAEFRRNGC